MGLRSMANFLGIWEWYFVANLFRYRGTIFNRYVIGNFYFNFTANFSWLIVTHAILYGAE